jgi:phosphate transport system substrate-binding protein
MISEMRRGSKVKIWALVTSFGLLCLNGMNCADAVEVDGTPTCFRALEELSKQYPGGMVKAPVNLRYGGSYIAVEKLGNGAIDIAVIEYPLRKYVDNAWAKAFPNGKAPAAQYTFAQTALGVVVNKKNALTRLTQGQLRDIWSGKVSSWGDAGGSGGRIKVLTSKALSGTMVSDMIVNYRQWSKEIRKLSADTNVIASVMGDADAIGFVALTPDLPKDVKLLAIALDAKSPAVQPTVENVVLERYFLVRQYKLILTEKSSAAAEDFARFACSEQASKIVQDWGLFPVSIRNKAQSDQRLADMRAGKGIRVSAVGIGSGRAAVQDLALEYVRSRAVIQASFAPVDVDVTAVGAFARAGAEATTSMPTTAPAVVAAMTPFVATGGKELLFLADKPSARAMELHGKQWNALGRDKGGKPNGTGPAEYLLAGRAAAVIVNPANKIDALTIGQLQAIFGGEVADWGTLGSTLSTGSGQAGLTTGGGAAKGTIKPYGLRSDDLATGIFEKECIERAKWKRVGIKKDSAEVLAAVSMDPQAIGFVDLAGIPATGQSIKILGIRLPGGGPPAPPPAAKAAPSPRGRGVYYPTPENLRSAMYPLSQRLWLYVHPQASDTAKDFVKFIATCGASEASPYADTVKAVMDTYRKNGLVPLADAALERMAKDAMAAAAARAKAEAEAKAKAGRGKKKGSSR